MKGVDDMKKNLKCLCIVMAVVMISCSAVFAASYTFTMIPPYDGCIRYSTGVHRTGGTPYVNPSVATIYPSTYVLVPQQSTRVLATKALTNISTAGRRNFTYNTGYGGNGQTYYLAGHCTEKKFEMYTVTGTWSP